MDHSTRLTYTDAALIVSALKFYGAQLRELAPGEPDGPSLSNHADRAFALAFDIEFHTIVAKADF